MKDTNKFILIFGVILFSIIIGIRIEALIENQNSDTISALIGWLTALFYFILSKNKDLN